MAIADSARAGDFASSSAASRASAFITVASMPIESARARSMPVSAACRPRKKLPPPTTTPISTPSVAALAMSRAMRATVGACRPKPPSPPVSASPESLMMTRFKSGLPLETLITAILARFGLRLALLLGRLLDAFAKGETDEADKLDRGAHLALVLLHRLPDRLAGMFGMDRGLIDERPLLVEGLHARLDDLVEHMSRLARVLVAQDAALALDGRRIERRRIERQWLGRRDMHRDLASQLRQRCLVALRFKRDDHADLSEAFGDRRMHILSDHAGRNRELRRTAQRHVLADRRDRVGDCLTDGAPAGIGLALQRLCVTDTLVHSDGDDRAHQLLEILIARHEIGFGIDLDDDAVIAAHRNGDEPFRRDAAGFFGSFRQAFLTQPIDGSFDVAGDFGQRVLAVHHAGAGLLAKILDEAGGNGGHFLLVLLCSRSFTRETDLNRCNGSRSLRRNALRGEQAARLIDPAVPVDAAVELQIAVDRLHVVGRHRGELPVMVDARVVELLLKLRSDTTELGEIFGRAARGRQKLEFFRRRLELRLAGSFGRSFCRSGLENPASRRQFLHGR